MSPYNLCQPSSFPPGHNNQVAFGAKRTRDKLATAARSVEDKPTLTSSPLRYPSHAHALNDALASGEVSRIVARYVGAYAANGKARI
jgi:hypothetical protein